MTCVRCVHIYVTSCVIHRVSDVYIYMFYRVSHTKDLSCVRCIYIYVTSCVRCRANRVAKTHRIPYLYRSFSAKVTYI